MDEQAVRDRAQSLCDALVSGDIGLASELFSKELRQNLGEVLSLLPLPSNEASIESIEHGGQSYSVILRLAGETDEVKIQTRWKEREGQPTVVEASHLSQAVLAPDDEAAEGDGDSDQAQGAGAG